MRSTAVARISNTVRARSATAVGEAKIQTPSDRLNTQERADYALVSDFIIQKSLEILIFVARFIVCLGYIKTSCIDPLQGFYESYTRIYENQ